jgi:2,4-dienoyl-CoA reductase-like NADH-dependent reductase (Old Yellow Enzyme family)
MDKKVFEKASIGGIAVKNRFVRSATASLLASHDGYVTEDVLEIHRELAQGEVGLIISEHIGVLADDTFAPNHLRIHDDSFMPGLKTVTDVVHQYGSKIVAQLGHCGTLIFEEPISPPLGPSAVKDLASEIMATEMSHADIRKLVDGFAQAALRSKQAGFDGVQLHAAHGFLLNKFLSPYYNRRSDEYGGSVAKRARIFVEMLQAIKAACGPDFPVFVKMNSSDFSETDPSFTFEEGRESAKLFAEAGFDALEVSGGVYAGKYSPARGPIRSKDQEAYHKEYGATVAGDVSVDVILVGGIRSLEVAEEILQETEIKAVALSRPLIAEPQLIKRWSEGDAKKAKCISCNKCFNPAGSTCILNK